MALLFGPSRFVGYGDNDQHTHKANDKKDGKETNPAINQIVGQRAEHSEWLEQEYLRLCDKIGVKPRATGEFGVKRRYWYYG